MGNESDVGLTKETIAELARRMGLTLGPEELEQLSPMINQQAQNLEALRKLHVDPDVAPDVLFSPEAE